MPKKQAQKSYTNETMQVHSDLENVRENPETYLGSATIEGCRHTFLEILANSLDEVKNGFGDTVEVKLYKDGSISVRDHGRGIPLAYNKKEKKDNWEIAYTILGGGGKFSNGSDSVYQQGTLGVHGIGAAATQLSSDWFIVDSYRDGKHYHVEFEDGAPKKGKNGKVLQTSKNAEDETGTFQWWKPSDEVFIDTGIDADYIRSVLKEQAIVTKEATLIFEDEASEGTDTYHDIYHYENGIFDFMLEQTDGGKDLLTDPVYIEAEGTAVDKDGHSGKFSEPYEVMVQICIGFSSRQQFTEYFHNSSRLIYGGSPDKALKKGMLQVIDAEIKTLGKYKAKEEKIKWSDIEEVLCYISNSFSGRTIFEGQTKFAINSPGVENFIYDTMRSKFSAWMTENRPMAEKICDLVLANKRARESAETIRTATKKKLTANMDITNKVPKFVDCRSKDPAERELFICLKGDTKVKLLDGTDQPIESLVGRTDLWGYSTDEIGRMIPAHIKDVFKTRDVTEMVRLAFDDGSVVECTPEHLFLAPETMDWVEAKDLVAGDALAAGGGRTLGITDIVNIHYDELIPVYCLTIESESHAFFLENGIITHNCEGDSALGSVKQGRNAYFQAIMPIRGKILNCYKADLSTILKSDIITDLIRVFGCGIETDKKHASKKLPQFDINNLNYSKIIILSDQDVDGFHIRCLVLTMIYRLCPELIRQGKVYIGESPLYEITWGTGKNEKHEFAFTDEERDRILKKIGNVPVQVSRSKGLGENDPEMMAIFMNPETRKLIKVVPNTVEEMNEWFELFMGSRVEPRKNYIVANLDQYQDSLDLTSE